MRTVLVLGAAWLALCGAAHANDVTYAADAGAAHLTGTVEIDDSSGDIVAVSGQASGAVSGRYLLSRSDPDAELTGEGAKLALHFDRRNQQVTAHLDACAKDGNCTAADPVTVFEKP
jgi:hypothetical protein